MQRRAIIIFKKGDIVKDLKTGIIFYIFNVSGLRCDMEYFAVRKRWWQFWKFFEKGYVFHMEDFTRDTWQQGFVIIGNAYEEKSDNILR